MGRSWADHGQTIGDRFMQKNPENFSFFRYRFFSEKLWKFAIFPLALNKAFSYFCRPRTCFLGKNCLFSESKINFTPWNLVLLSDWSILHLENAMFSKIRPYFYGRSGCQPLSERMRTCVLLIMAGNQHVLQSEHAFSSWLATSTSFKANMRSLNGWQPARFGRINSKIISKYF